MHKLFHPKCSKCGCIGRREAKYDAYYCGRCGEWIEKACSDPLCRYCVGRPDKPPKTKEKKNV